MRSRTLDDLSRREKYMAYLSKLSYESNHTDINKKLPIGILCDIRGYVRCGEKY
jgi:hypothetical protein